MTDIKARRGSATGGRARARLGVGLGLYLRILPIVFLLVFSLPRSRLAELGIYLLWIAACVPIVVFSALIVERRVAGLRFARDAAHGWPPMRVVLAYRLVGWLSVVVVAGWLTLFVRAVVSSGS